MKLSKIMLLAALISVPISAIAQTDVHPYLTDEVLVHAGGFFTRSNLDLSVEGSVGASSRQIDFERSLDIPSSDRMFDLEVNWRFGKKWSLRSQFFSADRDGSKTLESDIMWGDEIFLVGTETKSRSNLSVARVFFGRAFTTKDSVDAGFGFGVHYIDFRASLTGTIDVGGTPVADETRSVDFSGVLPNIGVWYSKSWHQNWAFVSRADWLEASIGDYRGGILNLSAGVNYQAFDHFGVGVSYQDFTLRLRNHDDKWTGRAKLSYRGAFVYITGNW